MTKRMISIEEAVEEILMRIRPLGMEKRSLFEANGYVNAEDVRTRISLPPFDRSMMDGYAVRAEDVVQATPEAPVYLRVLERVAAGDVPLVRVEKGQAVRIMTGAMMPEGANAVAKLEITDSQDHPGAESVGVRLPVKVGESISKLGEDLTPGDVILQKGSPIGANELTVLGSVGETHVNVWRKPRIGILVGGHELVARGEALSKGKIYESNSVMVAALVQKWGGIPVFCGLSEDDEELAGAAVAKAFEEQGVDALVTTGGVSGGDFDVTRGAVARAGGEVHFWQVAMRPGTPMTFSTWQGRPIFGLSGNPAAAIINAVLFLQPAMRAFLGMSAEQSRAVIDTAFLGEALQVKPIGLDRMMRAQVKIENGRVVATALPTGQKVGIISSLIGTDGWIRVRGRTLPQPGDVVEVYRA